MKLKYKKKREKTRQNIYNLYNEVLTSLTNKKAHKPVRSQYLYRKMDKKQGQAIYKGRNTNG